MNNIHYLETSAVNVFADELGVSDFAREFLRTSKVDWCISSIVLWEILLNGDEKRRDYLIYWLQEMSAGYLLKSPSELLVAYLRAATPQKDKKQFWYNRQTNSTLGEIWAAIHHKPDRTLLADVARLKEVTQHVRDLAKMHRSLILAMTDETEDGYDQDAFHRAMFALRESLGREAPPTKAEEKQLKISLILTFFFVCIGLDLENQPIRDYWKEIRIDHSEPFMRLYYLIENHHNCFIRGPLAEMSLMIEHQAFVAGTPNRGMLFDCLHTVYCYYADNLVAEDRHFHELREAKLAWMFDAIIPASKYVEMLEMAHSEMLKKVEENTLASS